MAVKHRHHVRWPRVTQQLMQRRHAGLATGRTLHGVQAADQIERVDNKQMKRHSDTGSPQAAFLMGYLMIS